MIDRRLLSLRPAGLGLAVARESLPADETLWNGISVHFGSGTGLVEVLDNFSGLIKLAESVSLSRLS